MNPVVLFRILLFTLMLFNKAQSQTFPDNKEFNFYSNNCSIVDRNSAYSQNPISFKASALKEGAYSINDYNNTYYKTLIVHSNRSFKSEIHLTDSVIQIDSTIFIKEFDKETIALYHFFMEYVEYPYHQAEVSRPIISFIVNSQGALIKMTILKDIKGRCFDPVENNNWHVTNPEKFNYKNQSQKNIEYILELEFACLCACHIEKSINKKNLNN